MNNRRLHLLRKAAQSQAFSLVEVVLAIGVTSFALLGMVALLPMGSRLRAKPRFDRALETLRAIHRSTHFVGGCRVSEPSAGGRALDWVSVFPLEFPFLRAVYEPQGVAGVANYVVGAMMTPDHAHFGERLAASCRSRALPLALFEVPAVHRSISVLGTGDPRYTKANFVHFLLGRYKCPVLYVDVDCEIVQEPVLMNDLAARKVDFAIFNWFAEEHTEAYVPAVIDSQDSSVSSSGRFYRFSHSIDVVSQTQLLCSGAVQWYNDTDAARHLLGAWQSVIERAPGRADDKCLDLAFNNYLTEAPKLKTAWLEKRYARYAWWIYERPIIDHPEFPSSGDGFVQLDELEGKPRFHRHLLRQTSVDYVFPKDCLIDSQTRTIFRFDNGTWRPVGPVSTPLWLTSPLTASRRDVAASAESRFHEALALHQQLRLDQAERAYEEVVAAQPRHVKALNFLAVLALESRRMDRALQMTARALEADPHNAGTHLLHGHALAELHRYAEAVASYDQAITFKPDLVEAYFHRGNVLAELGLHAPAVASYDKAIELRPDQPEVHNARGLSLYELKLYEAALASHDSAIAIKPEYAEAHLSRGNALHQLRRSADALGSFNRAISHREDYALAYSNRGNVLSELEQFEAALASYDRAVSLDPRRPEFHCNRGTLLVELQRYDEARTSFDRALDIDPDHALAHFGRSFPALLMGDFENGWRDFEWRWKNEHIATSKERRQFSAPRWQGDASLAGKAILLHSEQGLGDTIQFCRFAEILAKQGARVILEAPKSLLGLLASLRGVTQLVAQGDPLPTFDYWCPLLSLPMALNIKIDSIPARIPYLQSRVERVRYWRDKLGPRTKARVGLVWSGGFRPDQPELWAVNGRRNIPLRRLAGLKHPDIQYYSLQKGQSAEQELARLTEQNWDGPALIDYTSELHDFEETAALVAQLDLVISVDTSTAHLAGALGKPVWLLNRFDTCWRWLANRTDSPWYPSLRPPPPPPPLYRQARRGDWESVLRDVGHGLEQLVLDGHAGR